MLADLLGDIKRDSWRGDVRVLVLQDGGAWYPYKVRHMADEWMWMSHHGRQQYWQLVNEGWDRLRNMSWEYFVWLPDDVRLGVDFFARCSEAYSKASKMDPAAICLSPLIDTYRYGKAQWTGFPPIRIGGLWLTQWMDCCCYAPRRMLEVLGWRLHRPRMLKPTSSGVGAQISKSLQARGYHMWHVDSTLVSHGLHKSHMNRMERQKRPLVT